MINFLVNCSYCKDGAVLSVMYIVRQILGVIFILVPIILIVLVLIDLVKNVVAGKEEDMTKGKKIIIKRIIYAVVIFFVPAIVNIFMRVMYDVVDGGSEQSFLQCWNNADNVNKVSQCNAEVTANEIAEDIEKKRKSDEKKANYEASVNEKNKSREKGLSGKEETSGDSGNNSSNGDNGDGSELSSTVDNYTVYTGDSRANLMCYYTNISPLGGGSNNSNEKCVVAPGKAYTYFHSDVLKELDSILKDKNNANIVLASWGTNDISPNIFPKEDVMYPGTYFSKMYFYDYKYLANKYPNAKIVVVSILYFDESKHGAIMFKLKNSLVDNFNNNMKSSVSGISNIVYCDITSAIGTSLDTPDGIHHYGAENNQKILSEIKKCL